MGRWTALVILMVLHKYISSEPITDTSNNVRPSRQLDFQDSCSCEDLDKSHSRRDTRYDDANDAGTEDLFLRSPDWDDCPCRIRDTDSQGASSILFPTAMRSAANLLRPTEKKDELKPLFNPEVDLASSVLETLRIATDEEYQEALARDAAKNAARAVEGIVFGDTDPQESANIVTIVVSPKAVNDNLNDDIISQESQIKQSRCIHPLKEVSNPNFILDTPILSKLRPTLSNRNFYDMDHNIGASSVHEHITPLEEDTNTIKTSPLTARANLNIKSHTLNNKDNENYKLPYLKSIPVQSKIKKIDILSSPLLKKIRERTKSSYVPNFRLQSSPEKLKMINDDLSPASSIVQEQAAKRVPYHRTNFKQENLKQNSRPLSFTNLLNLKDVELIPLKDLVSNHVKKNDFNKAKTVFPSMTEHDDVSLVEKKSKDTEDWKITPFLSIDGSARENFDDPVPSPSLINSKVLSYDAPITDSWFDSKKVAKEKDDKEMENVSRSMEITDILRDTKKQLSKIKFNNETDCIADKKNEQDSITDETSNNSHNIIDQPKFRLLGNKNLKPDQDVECDEEKITVNHDNSKSKLLDPISIDKTLSSIKNLILKKQEDLKIMKTNLKNKNISKQENTIGEHKNKNDALMQIATPSIISKQNKNTDNSKDSILNQSKGKDTEGGTTVPSTLANYEIGDLIDDPESSPSVINMHVIPDDTRSYDDRCESEKIVLETSTRESENYPFSVEILDTLTGAPNVVPKVTNSNDILFIKNIKNDQGSDASNNSGNIINQKEVNLNNFDTEAIDYNKRSKNIQSYSKPQLLDPVSLDKTISKVKKYILQKQEDLKNIKINKKNKNLLSHENKDILVTKNKNQDYENEESIQVAKLMSNFEEFSTPAPNLLDEGSEDSITTSKPTISSQNRQNISEYTEYDVSMQDLQNMSDSMLQQEQHKSKHKEPKKQYLENGGRSSDDLDLDNSANSPTEVTMGSENMANSQCKMDLASQLSDSNTGASDMVIRSIRKEDPNLQSALNPAITLLKNSLHDVNDILKQPPIDPLPAVDEIKEKLMNFIDQSARDVTQSEPFVTLNPVLSTDASKSLDKTISTVKKYILQKQEDLKNIKTNKKTKNLPSHENKDTLVTKNENQDYENEAPIQVTTLTSNFEEFSTPTPNLPDEDSEDSITTSKPSISSQNRENISEYTEYDVNMQDLQNMSDSMLQKEQHESKYKEPKNQYLENGGRSTDDLDLDNSANSPTEVTMGSENMANSQCKMDLASQLSDSNTDASDMVIRSIRKEDPNLQSALNPAITLLKDPLSDVSDISKLPPIDPLPAVDEIKTKLMYLIDKSARDITQPEPFDTLNPVLSTDASKSISLDKTISTVKKYILQKQEDLKNLKTNIKNKNLLRHENKDVLVTKTENKDCENEASIQETTLTSNFEEFLTPAPNLPDEDSEHSTTTSKPNNSSQSRENISEYADVRMQDLQNMSDFMLQPEEYESKYKESNKQYLENERSSDDLDLENSANMPAQVIVESKNIDNSQCKMGLGSQLSDSNTGASDMVIKSISKVDPNLQSALNPAITLLKNPLKDVSDYLKLPSIDPLPAVDEIKAKLMNLIDKSTRDVTQSEQFDTLNPVMATDASVSSYQSKILPVKHSEGINFDILKLKPQTSIFPKFSSLGSQLFKIEPKLQKKSNSKPINLKSALDNKRGKENRLNTNKYIFQSSQREDLNNLLNIRPSLDNLKDRLLNTSPKATNNKVLLNSKLKNNNNNKFSTLRSSTKSLPSLLDTWSKNNEDINDKLRAIHVDFSDRLESVRNDLIDKSKLLYNEPRFKPNFRSFSKFDNQSKGKQSKLAQAKQREPEILTGRKQTPVRISSSLRALEQKKLRMPTAASVPVPRTVQVPELITTSARSPPLTSRKESYLVPSTNTKLSKDISRNLGESKNFPYSKLLLRNKNILGNDNKIKVSFSTTSKPEILNGNRFQNLVPQNTNLKKIESRKVFNDHNGSPSEIKDSKMLPPDYEYQDKNRISNARKDYVLPDQTKVPTEKDHQREAEPSLLSWPKATENAFLSKVKDAVKARFAEVNSAKPLKKISVPVDEVNEKTKVSVLKSDMDRSASENKEIIGRSLKENVSYKCKMICTEER